MWSWSASHAQGAPTCLSYFAGAKKGVKPVGLWLSDGRVERVFGSWLETYALRAPERFIVLQRGQVPAP